MDADRRGEDRHVAGERLQHGQPEALALGWHQHGVGGIDPQGHALGVDRAERQQLDSRGVRERERAIVVLLRAGGVCGKQEVRQPGVQAQLGACLRAGKRMEAIEVHAAGQHLRAPPRRPSGQFAHQRRGGGGEQVDQRQYGGGGDARAGMAEVCAVHRQRTHSGRDREGGPGGEAKVRVHDVEARR